MKELKRANDFLCKSIHLKLSQEISILEDTSVYITEDGFYKIGFKLLVDGVFVYTDLYTYEGELEEFLNTKHKRIWSLSKRISVIGHSRNASVTDIAVKFIGKSLFENRDSLPEFELDSISYIINFLLLSCNNEHNVVYSRLENINTMELFDLIEETKDKVSTMLV